MNPNLINYIFSEIYHISRMAEEDAIDKIKQAIKTAEQFSDLYYRF